MNDCSIYKDNKGTHLNALKLNLIVPFVRAAEVCENENTPVFFFGVPAGEYSQFSYQITHALV